MSTTGSRAELAQHIWDVVSAGGSVQIEGPAGIGKSTLLHDLHQRGRDAGWVVLSCAPTEVEQGLSFAALADLLRPLSSGVDRLPTPQRVAAQAVLLGSVPDQRVDERAVGAATASLLAAGFGASDQRLLVTIDDAPWLDTASAHAVSFALRRVAVPLVTVVRTDGAGATSTSPLLRHDTVRREVPPLRPSSVMALLRQEFGATFSRPLLARIADEAGGNPLLALDLARAVLRLPRPPAPTEDLPMVGASVRSLATAALATLPAQSLEALRLASLMIVPRIEDLRRAGVDIADLVIAEDAGLARVGATRIEFRHPVYATAVRADIASGERRSLRERLAKATDDPDERARHLALSIVGTDAAAAGEIEQAGGRERDRGAPSLGAELLIRAANLTPPGDVTDRERRLLGAARCHFDAGDYAATTTVAADLIGSASPETQAEAHLLRAFAAWYEPVELADDGEQHARRAVAVAPPGSLLSGKAQSLLAIFCASTLDAAAQAAKAVEILDAASDSDELLAPALFQLFYSEVMLGRPVREDLLNRGLALERDVPSWQSGTIPAIFWTLIDEHDRAQRRLRVMRERADHLGDDTWRHEVLCHLVTSQMLNAQWSEAQVDLTELLELGQQLGAAVTHEQWLEAEIKLRLGEVDQARAIASAGLDQATSIDSHARRRFLHVLALADLTSGRPAEAATAYADIAALFDASGVLDSPIRRYEPDWAEALTALGDLTGAETVLDGVRERHRRLPRPWAALGLARCDLLIAEARGDDLAPALAAAEAAVAAVPPQVLPLDRGRTLLAIGEVRQRCEGTDGSEHLAAAEAVFDQIGARGFAARARSSRIAHQTRDPDVVRRALRDYRKPAELAASPLATGDSVADRAESVRALLQAAITETFDTGADEQLLRAMIETGYLTPDGGHTEAMRRLHLSRTTYYRRLAEATERLVQHLSRKP